MGGLILIRHAAPAAPERERFLGQRDVEAEPRELAKAAEIGEAIAASRVVSSPLKRALATAWAAFGRSVTIEVDRRLMERSFGVWEGETKGMLRTKHPEWFHPSGRARPDITPPGGESMEDVVNRVRAFLAECWCDNQGNLVVVTHNGVIAAVRHLVWGRSLEECYAEDASYLMPVVIERPK